ncbi:MAG TPA: hypothetical protein VGJ86_06740 [Acidimicrobiales bacterium]|jgi:hypothetical protein
MDRREFITAAVAIPTAASIDGLDSIAPATPPARVGATDIAQVRDAAISVKRGDMRWGGGFGFDAALVSTRRARDLLEARCPERLRPDLFVAVGWLASNTGFMAFDSQRYRDAARLWNVASRCAEDAMNWSLQARVLGCMARQATWLDRPDDAVGLLQRAIDGDRGQLVPTERAMLWALRARACAQMGDAAGAEEAIGSADQWFAARRPKECEDRPWVAHYSHEHHWGDTGLAWHHLAVNSGDPHAVVEAAGRHQAAADGHRTDEARSHALSLVALAKLDARVGDLDRGVAAGHRALDAALQVRSGRVREDLVALYEATGKHAARSDVAELRERIASSLLVA